MQRVSRMAPLETRERSYPRPAAYELIETIFGWHGVRELLSYTFEERQNWKWFLNRKVMQPISP